MAETKLIRGRTPGSAFVEEARLTDVNTIGGSAGYSCTAYTAMLKTTILRAAALTLSFVASAAFCPTPTSLRASSQCGGGIIAPAEERIHRLGRKGEAGHQVLRSTPVPDGGGGARNDPAETTPQMMRALWEMISDATKNMARGVSRPVGLQLIGPTT
ncbi:hypothetical protein THAOC_31596 [Thalassiosira oceanica]|uniref:Uncharacterized protein n=1 Tax=Thalassiosira oceanica TaxID=159749 RepID=K0RKV7_THAOC|nr:hypothetical protein THAOC_31596 [Thalassiosira oceanica]|eukprot:EJK49521.1 hypothetical protein THAOC_31596 [Thalassiosira oceanica]